MTGWPDRPDVPFVSVDALRDNAAHLLDLGYFVGPAHYPAPGERHRVRCSCWRRERCENTGKHPRDEGWPERARSAPRPLGPWTTARLAAAHPWNVYIATGEQRDGTFVVVVDIDGGTIDGLPASPMVVATPKIGREHRYFRSESRHGNSTGSLAPGIDTRGAGGLAIVPPSRRLDGRYEWLCGPVAPSALPLLPDIILEALRPPERVVAPTGLAGWEQSDAMAVEDWLANASRMMACRQPGSRNVLLWSLCVKGAAFADAGLLDPVVVALVLGEAAAEAGLEDYAVRSILRRTLDEEGPR